MRPGRTLPLLLVFLACLLAVGLPYWPVPYGTLGVPSPLMKAGLVAVGIAALALRASGFGTFRQAFAVTGASVPAAVTARVVVEVVKDSTSHNLWPFEILLAALVGFACSLAGAVAGLAIAKLRPRDRRGAG